MYYSTTYPSPVGLLTLACDLTGSKLVGVWLEGQKYHGNTIMDGMTEKSGMPCIRQDEGLAGPLF